VLEATAQFAGRVLMQRFVVVGKYPVAQVKAVAEVHVAALVIHATHLNEALI